MSDIDDKTLAGYTEAAAEVLRITVEPEWRATIDANLRVTLRLAMFVADFELPDSSEPAPVFRA